MLSLHWNQNVRSSPRIGKLFQFEAMWLHDPWCSEVAIEAWECGLAYSNGYPIKNYLQLCKEALTQWNKVEFSHVGQAYQA